MNINQETLAARNFLESPKKLNERINLDFMHLQRLRKIRDQFGGSTLQREKVQGGQLPHSPITRIIDQITDLEREIDRELLEYDALMRAVKQSIFYCNDDREIKVLTKKFLEEKCVAEIAEEIYFSENRIYDSICNGLKKVQQYMEENGLKGYDNGAGQED